MLKNIDHSNVNSRRAYPLNSRSSWVEQTHHKGINVYRDNLVLGPAEYSPKPGNERHVGTPVLSQRSRTSFVDAFHPFRSQLSIGHGSISSSIASANSSLYTGGDSSVVNGSNVLINAINTATAAATARGYTIVDDVTSSKFSYYQKTESATIFHDHDRRQGTDPHRRYCTTPGASLTHDSILHTRSCHGVTTPGKVHFGPDDIPFGERTLTLPAGPSYQPNYNSKVIRPAPKLTKISPTKRSTYVDEAILKAVKNDRPRATASVTAAGASSVDEDERHDSLSYNHNQQKQQQQQVAGPGPCPSPIKAKMPHLRTRLPPPLTFNTDCYTSVYKAQDKQQIPLNPSSINRLAKVDVFAGLMSRVQCVPRGSASASASYGGNSVGGTSVSGGIGSKISERVRRGAL